jgi:hypothetical protein
MYCWCCCRRCSQTLAIHDGGQDMLEVKLIKTTNSGIRSKHVGGGSSHALFFFGVLFVIGRNYYASRERSVNFSNILTQEYLIERVKLRGFFVPLISK